MREMKRGRERVRESCSHGNRCFLQYTLQEPCSQCNLMVCMVANDKAIIDLLRSWHPRGPCPAGSLPENIGMLNREAHLPLTAKKKRTLLLDLPRLYAR